LETARELLDVPFGLEMDRMSFISASIPCATMALSSALPHEL